jgi:hypothetical protein
VSAWDCTDCTSLYRAYAAAANRHVALIRAHNEAIADGDSGRCAMLDPEIEDASFARDQAWLALQVHRTAPHNWVRENVYCA